MMRRGMALLAAGGAFALVVGACGDDGDPDASNDDGSLSDESADEAEDADGGEPTTITFWNGFTDTDRPIVEEIVRRFNDSQDDVVVDMTINAWDSLIPSLLPAYSAGEGPTIVGLGAENFPGLVEQGVWAPLDDLYDSDLLDPSTLPGASLDATTYDGTQYGVPMAATAGMLYYNKELFADAGLAGPPETLDELAEFAVELTDATAGRHGLALPDHAAMPSWAVLLWANGGGIVSDDNSHSTLAEPASIEAAEFWTELIINENITPVGMSGVEADNLFASGQAAMEFNGPWAAALFEEADIDFGMVPVPPGTATQAAAAVSVNMHLNADANEAEQEAAHEFMAFWNSEESQTYWSINSGFPPNRTDVPASAVSENATSAAFSEAAGARLYLRGLTQASQIDNDIVIPTIQRMTRGEGTPEELLTEAAEQIDAMLSE